jgi:XTP/dITP diphosphohydrolase
VQQEVRGFITHSPSGTEGFGYDPIFFLPEMGCTMAELSTNEKNRLSARGKALADLRKFLLTS